MPFLFGRGAWCVLACLPLFNFVASAQPNRPAGPKSVNIEPHGIVVSFPDNWRHLGQRYTNLVELASEQLAWPGTESQVPAAKVVIFVETYKNHPEAVQRLKFIEAEVDDPATFLEIGGWPAVQIRYHTTIKHPGAPGSPGDGYEEVLQVTTAVAMGNKVVRLDGTVQPGVDESIADEIEIVGQGAMFSNRGVSSATRQDIQQLRNSPRIKSQVPTEPNENSAPGAAGTLEASSLDELSADSAGLSLRLQGTANGVDAEIEIVASNDGRYVVVANNSRSFRSSDNGGVSFDFGGSAPVPAGAGANGDPSLAYGASGSFYLAYIGFPNNANPVATQQCSTAITRSDDNGQMFQFVANATVCSNADITNGVAEPNNSCFPDQEHIAADRWNLSSSGQDQVYSAWRDFSAGGCGPTGSATAIAGPEIPSIVCSTDSGATWTAKAAVAGSGSYSRITTGQDGSVYVVFRQNQNIVLQKYSSCDTGLAPIGGIVTIAAGITDVTCNQAFPGAVPGLDRCNNGSNLSSHTVAVDDTDANHVYAAYAVNTVSGRNENVLVRDSTDGGASWPNGRVVQVNNGQVARRFMPWVCSTGGRAYVSWYDMRLAAGAAGPGTGLPNDLADFFGASAFRNTNGDLTAGTEFRISEISDPLCGSGWPSAPRSQWDSETCGVQPQLAGVCTDGAGNTFNRCDFSDCGGAGMNTGGSCQCAAGRTCNTGRGVPKYGDYNGNACAAGRFFGAWASATSPPYISPASTDIDVFFFNQIVCCSPQIQVPTTLSFTEEACVGSTISRQLNVCNTGKDDLRVDRITSSDDQFAVVETTGQFPVVISPDFCFPFEVEFTPDGTGPATATLTIDTNDPVSPSVIVQANASSGEPEINVTLVDQGSFPDTCAGALSDLTLQILNEGTCTLNVSAITLSDTTNFELTAETDIPFDLQPGSNIDIPIRFSPPESTTCSDTTTIAGTVTVESDDADESSIVLDISGIVPCPDLNVAIANSGDFGQVCLGDQADLDLTLFNQGKCDLTIDSISVDNPNFILPANTQYPLVLSHDAEFTLPVRFQPGPEEMCSDDTPQGGVITIDSDSPGEEMLEIEVGGSIPCPNLVIDPAALTGLYSFPATVVDTTGSLGCFSEKPVVVRNTGACPLTIEGMTADGIADPDDFDVLAPTQFPIVLPPGEETLVANVRFTPQSDSDPMSPSELLGTLTVNSDDPDAAGTADLCGQSSAQSGVQMLVTDVTTGTPLPVNGVDRITLTSKGKNTPSPVSITLTDAPVLSANVCGNTILYHLDAEILGSAGTTGNNPKSSYQTTAKEGNLQASQSLNLQQCELAEFQLQLTANSGGEPPACMLGQKGDACTLDSECCSNKCAGQPGNMTCK